MKATNLDEYMTCYGAMLGQQAGRTVAPLHVPGRDVLAAVPLLRQPFEPQAHVIAAGIKALRRQKALLIVAECGTGKTLMGAATCHGHAGGRPYRGLVFCPPHLTRKWQRELEQTIPGAKVRQIDGYRDLLRLDRRVPATAPEWWVVSQQNAKMGPGWRPSFTVRKLRPGILYCPHCGAAIEDEDKEEGCMVPVGFDELARKRRYCHVCQGPLWTYRRDIDRWPAAAYIHKKLRGFFDYLIVDEVHQEKGDDTAQANAMGALAAASGKVVALTGTLIGGYADHLRTLMLRLAPRSLVAEGFGWRDHMPFNEKYGRIERKVTTRESKGKSNSQSRGSQTKTVKYVRPGVMPTLYGRHLIGSTVFLSLAELADNLPPLDETVVPVSLDAEQAEAYREIEAALTAALKDLVRKGNKRLLGPMLQTLLCYPDQPHGWDTIGYTGKDSEGRETWVPVVKPPDLDRHTLRPKESALVADVVAERDRGRQAWVFTTMTDKRDVCNRLQELLERKGLRTAVLRAKVTPKEREAWIAKTGPYVDCVLSHPQLVETGLDLFEHSGRFNFATLMFYLTGYNLFTLRQASRRAWRIGQALGCKVKYFYYAGTMQERAMCLMGKKLAAAEALEGKFSDEGLAAMAGDEGSMEMALARSLVQQLDETDAAREWRKVCKVADAPAIVVAPRPVVALPIRTARAAQLALFDFSAA